MNLHGTWCLHIKMLKTVIKHIKNKHIVHKRKIRCSRCVIAHTILTCQHNDSNASYSFVQQALVQSWSCSVCSFSSSRRLNFYFVTFYLLYVLQFYAIPIKFASWALSDVMNFLLHFFKSCVLDKLFEQHWNTQHTHFSKMLVNI